MGTGRFILGLLVAIHWVLPFTPANPHEETRILVASVVLGAAFLALCVRSFKRPWVSFPVAAGLLSVVVVVSAVTGASPLQEGAVVKVLFLGGLVWATRQSLRGRSQDG